MAVSGNFKVEVSASSYYEPKGDIYLYMAKHQIRLGNLSVLYPVCARWSLSEPFLWFDNILVWVVNGWRSIV